MSSFVVFETKDRFLRGLTTLISLACLMVEPLRTACHTLLWSTFRVCHFFGIAKVLNPETSDEITHDSTATAMGLMTPEYASPEQVYGKSPTPASDVYSLG